MFKLRYTSFVSSMKNNPKSVKRISDSLLEIIWQDNNKISIPSRILRLNCPCASCGEKRGERSHSTPLTAPTKSKSMLTVVSSDIEREAYLEQIWGIGNYALGCRWGDGHDSGIYTYELLANLSEIISKNPS
jgi:DUF971 family protein